MGLSSYGKLTLIVVICDGRLTNLDFIIPVSCGSIVKVEASAQAKQCSENNSDWHCGPELVGQYRKDIAYVVQKSSENRVIDLIESPLK